MRPRELLQVVAQLRAEVQTVGQRIDDIVGRRMEDPPAPLPRRSRAHWERECQRIQEDLEVRFPARRPAPPPPQPQDDREEIREILLKLVELV